MNRLSVVVAIALSACDFQPGPTKQAAPVAAATPIDAAVAPPPVPPPPPPPTAPPADAAPAAPPAAGSGSAEGQPSQACVDAGVKFATLAIEHAPDPQIRSQYEQEKPRIIASTASGCMKAAWTQAQIACLIAADSVETARACVKPAAPAQ